MSKRLQWASIRFLGEGVPKLECWERSPRTTSKSLPVMLLSMLLWVVVMVKKEHKGKAHQQWMRKLNLKEHCWIWQWTTTLCLVDQTDLSSLPPFSGEKKEQTAQQVPQCVNTGRRTGPWDLVITQEENSIYLKSVPVDKTPSLSTFTFDRRLSAFLPDQKHVENSEWDTQWYKREDRKPAVILWVHMTTAIHILMC